MLTALLLLCFGQTAADLDARAALALASTPTPPAAKCRCGDNCPLKGTCGDNCGCAAIPARPEGDGWRWDAKEGCWWRYVTAPPVTHPSHTSAAPIPGFSAFGTPPAAFQSLTRHAPAYSRGAASCAT